MEQECEANETESLTLFYRHYVSLHASDVSAYLEAQGLSALFPDACRALMAPREGTSTERTTTEGGEERTSVTTSTATTAVETTATTELDGTTPRHLLQVDTNATTLLGDLNGGATKNLTSSEEDYYNSQG